jgi:hypothetical protein
MLAPERKADGEMRPRIETWANVASHLRRLVGPKLGKKLAADVTRNDIAELPCIFYFQDASWHALRSWKPGLSPQRTASAMDRFRRCSSA